MTLALAFYLAPTLLFHYSNICFSFCPFGSIKVRTTILQRGLADRSATVTKECLKLLKDEWLVKCCNRDPIELLKYLDVETYELVGESVMEALLKAGVVQLQDDQSIQQFIVSTSNENEGWKN